MARKYFGTDGIRGEANKELTLDISVRLGLALGYELKRTHKGDGAPRIVLGTDTRVSGYMIRSALSAGLMSMGINIDFVGVLPTPGIAYLTRRLNADAGIMISASHNPVKDNGIKIFSKTGYKLPDDVEERIEELMDNTEEIKKYQMPGDLLGKYKYVDEEFRMYVDFLSSTIKTNLKGKKVVIDAANGAAYRIASKVFHKLGADVVVINNIPNGKNINVDCGSTHPELLQKVVKVHEADIGLAYDGDADRLIAVDEKGNLIDGDLIIAVIATEWKKQGLLNENKVVTTVSSNMGFEKYLEDNGIALIRANVGDRYVLEKLKKHGLNLGGEQSGHIVMMDYNTTGDGILASLHLLEALIKSNKTLSEAVSEINLWPQRLENIKVSKDKKATWETNKELQDIIKKSEVELGKQGRILVRASGTEPLIRVMVEAKTQKLVDDYVDKLVGEVKKYLT